MDRKPVSGKSYANILVKYWGRKDAEKMIPSTSGISLALENMYTETQLSPLPDSATGDEFYMTVSCKARQNMPKSVKIIDRFRSQKMVLSALIPAIICQLQQGLSSSSSGLSALVKACNAYFLDGLSDARAGAQLAKFASGSSARSFFGPRPGIRTVGPFIQSRRI